MDDMSSKVAKVTKFIGFYIIVSLVCSAYIAVDTETWPKSYRGWILLFIFAFPICMFFSFLGEKLFHEKISEKLEVKQRINSPKRMIYTFVVLLLTSSLTILLYYVAKRYLNNVFSFR